MILRKRQFVLRSGGKLLMNESYVLQMRDPWSLMYGEYEQDFIDALREKIGPKHPLYNREVYAIAVRRNPGAVLYQAFNDGFYAIVYFPVYQKAGGGCRRQRSSLTNRPSAKRLPPITPNSWSNTSAIGRYDRPQLTPACDGVYVRL
jgi:hypothetical protein